MKTLGRILVIFVVFNSLAASMILAVNTLGMVLSDSRGDPRPEFRPPDEGEAEREVGEDNDEEDEAQNDRGFLLNILYMGARWTLSTGKNVFVMGILVLAIVLPRSFFRNKKKTSAGSP